jgi:hypothetical protein
LSFVRNGHESRQPLILCFASIGLLGSFVHVSSPK